MHTRGWKRLLALTMALLTLLTTPALAERAAYVSDYAAPVYADASLNERIGTIARGAYLTVNAEQNGIADITWYGRDGYVPLSALAYVGDGAEDAVVIRQTRFHQLPDQGSAYGILDAGTAVKLMAVNGTCAMIEYDGHIGFAMRTDIRTAGEGTSSGTAPTQAPQSSVVRETFTVMVAAQGASVYRQRSTAAQRMSVAQGRVLTAVAYDDSWVQVYNGSVFAFIPRSDVKRVEETPVQPTATPTAAPTATPAPTEAPQSSVVRETFTVMVTAQGASVYRQCSTAAQRMSVAQGRVLTAVAYDDSWVQVYNGSVFAFIPRSDVKRVEETPVQPTATPMATPTAAPTATPAPTQDSGVVQETFTATVTAQGARVYASASTEADSQALGYGITVTVLAYDGTWAQITNGTLYGFTQRTNLTPGVVSVATPTPTPVPTPVPTPTPGGGTSFEDAMESGEYSNEELTFLYLTREAGLNAAAACGVLANIKAESSFRPNAYNSNGGSYGICQWTGGRKTRLQNYCEDNGLDYTTLYGQLRFLEYELQNYYSKVWKYITAVDNTADGAYDAGYYFCYHFEVPANRASRSVTRGNSARDTYWPKYT